MAPRGGTNASKEKRKANRHDRISTWKIVLGVIILSSSLFYIYEMNQFLPTFKVDIWFSDEAIEATVEEPISGAHLLRKGDAMEMSATLNIKIIDQESSKKTIEEATGDGGNVEEHTTGAANLRERDTMELSATNTKIEQESSEKVITKDISFSESIEATDAGNVVEEPTSGAHLRKGDTMEISAAPKTKIEQESSEKVITNDKKLDPSSSPAVYGAACLLIKDDNTRLIEWLAYHYTRLPLRYLIVAVDPDSETSPETILERWKYSRKTDLEYILWNDNDYMTPIQMMQRDAAKGGLQLKLNDKSNLYSTIPVENEAEQTKLSIEIHRQRQHQFLSNCYRHHKLMGRSWVIHTDTDEYVLFNNKKQDEPSRDENGKSIVPNRSRAMLPTFGKKKKILDVITTYPKVFGNCVGMIRLLFGNKKEESSSIPKEYSYYNEATKANQNFDLDFFDTLRYSYHHPKGFLHKSDELGPIFNGLGKVMLDVSRVSYQEFDSDNLNSIHRPLTVCPSNWVGPEPYVKSLLRVNHYLGVRDAYNPQADSRRSRDIFYARANAASGPSYDIRPWLEQFTGEVGIKEAKRLLDGIGGHQLPKEQLQKQKGKDEEEKNSNEGAAISSYLEDFDSKSCAILFFGFGRKFKQIVYPSVKEYILDVNPTCDVFFHTYDAKNAKADELLLLFEKEDDKVIIDDTKMMIETKEEFEAKHNYRHYSEHFSRPSNSTTKNRNRMNFLIRQWHSIESVWHLMRQEETKYHKRYDRVGFFRPDVLYTNPINIMKSNSKSNEEENQDDAAVIPSRMYECTVGCGLNDRMFYGDRMYAEPWANQRFDNLLTYLQYEQAAKENNTAMTTVADQQTRINTEDFLQFMFTKKYPTVPLTQKDMCVQRVKSNGTVVTADCDVTTKPTNAAANKNAGGISNDDADEDEDAAFSITGVSEQSNPYNLGPQYDYRECTSPESHVPFPLEGDVHSKTSLRTCGMQSNSSIFTSFFEGSLWKQKFQPLIRNCTKLAVFGVAFGGNFVSDLDAPHVQRSVKSKDLIKRHGRCFFILTTEDDIERIGHIVKKYNGMKRSLNDPISIGHNIVIPLPKTVLPYNNPRRNVKLLKYMGQYMFQDSETVIWQDAKFFRGDFVSKQPVDYADLIEKDSCVLTMGLPVHKNTVGLDNIGKGILMNGRYRPQYEHHCHTIIAALASRPDVTDSSENLIRQCYAYLKHVYQQEGNTELMNQGLIDSAFIVWNQKKQSCRDFSSALRCTIIDQIHCHSDRDQVSIPFSLYSMGVSGMYREEKGESLKAVDISWDPTIHDLDFVSKTNEATSLGRSQVMFRVTRSSCHWYFSKLGNCNTDLKK